LTTPLGDEVLVAPNIFLAEGHEKAGAASQQTPAFGEKKVTA